MTRVLGLFGSGEFLPWAADVDRLMLSSASGGDGSVAVLPTAAAPEGDDVFDKWGSMGVEHYSSLGVEAVVVPLKTRPDAFEPKLIATVERASLVFFSGGNPAYLAGVLRETPLWRRLLEMLSEGVAIGGCSAGACIMGEQAPDESDGTFDSRGLSVVPGIVFGAHWDALNGYVPGLREQWLASLPDGATMLGIDEETAIVGDGSTWRVMGRGAATLYRSTPPSVFPAGETFQL